MQGRRSLRGERERRERECDRRVEAFDDPDGRIDRLNDDRYTWLFVLCPLTRRTEEIRRSEKVRERRGINISFRNPWKRYLDYDADINDEVISMCLYDGL